MRQSPRAASTKLWAAGDPQLNALDAASLSHRRPSRRSRNTTNTRSRSSSIASAEDRARRPPRMSRSTEAMRKSGSTSLGGAATLVATPAARRISGHSSASASTLLSTEPRRGDDRTATGDGKSSDSSKRSSTHSPHNKHVNSRELVTALSAPNLQPRRPRSPPARLNASLLSFGLKDAGHVSRSAASAPVSKQGSKTSVLAQPGSPVPPIGNPETRALLRARSRSAKDLVCEDVKASGTDTEIRVLIHDTERAGFSSHGDSAV